jgi:hypothetical protein
VVVSSSTVPEFNDSLPDTTGMSGWTKPQGFGITTGQQLIPDGAYRANQHKPNWELMPVDALEEVARVFSYGAQKYDLDNWRKGFPWRSVVGSSIRHIMAWLGGEDNDPESKLSHLSHAVCNLLFLLDYQKHNVGVDDRYRYKT